MTPVQRAERDVKFRTEVVISHARGIIGQAPYLKEELLDWVRDMGHAVRSLDAAKERLKDERSRETRAKNSAKKGRP